MKKFIVTTVATTALALGACAQGSIGQIQGMFSTDGITTSGLNASNPALADGGLYYSGNITLALFYASTASVTADQIAAINALDGVSGVSQYALMIADGFSLVSATPNVNSTTAGSLNFVVNSGGFTAADPNTIGLVAPAPTGVDAWIAMYAVATGGAFDGYSGILAFAQNTGGNPTTTPAGTASVMATDPQNLNLVLTTAVPEPGTMALAALGGASLLFLRRRNKA
jgi:hypothetical protein